MVGRIFEQMIAPPSHLGVDNGDYHSQSAIDLRESRLSSGLLVICRYINSYP